MCTAKSDNKKIESPKINIKVPLVLLDAKQEVKNNLKANIIKGVKDAIDVGIENFDNGKEVVRINAEKGPNVNLPIVQTSCCTKEKATGEKIIDVEVHLKSKGPRNWAEQPLHLRLSMLGKALWFGWVSSWRRSCESLPTASPRK